MDRDTTHVWGVSHVQRLGDLCDDGNGEAKHHGHGVQPSDSFHSLNAFQAMETVLRFQTSVAAMQFGCQAALADSLLSAKELKCSVWLFQEIHHNVTLHHSGPAWVCPWRCLHSQ